ncbi:Uncharacterized protein FWK35_00026716, partial [Aphis craccivora]
NCKKIFIIIGIYIYICIKQNFYIVKLLIEVFIIFFIWPDLIKVFGFAYVDKHLYVLYGYIVYIVYLYVKCI